MQLSTAHSLQNRGSFRIEDTAFKMGDSSRDRQSGGETFMPYQQGDALHFRPYTAQLSAPTEPTGLALWVSRLMGLDARVFTALIPAVLFAALLSGFGLSTLPVLALSASVYFCWYVMSFFNFERVVHNALNGPRQTRHLHHQVPATF